MAFVVLGCGGTDATTANTVPTELVDVALEPTTTVAPTTTTTTTTVPPTTTAPTSTVPPVPPVTTLSPAEIDDRRLSTVDVLTPPVDDQFVSVVTTPAPVEVIARSTWTHDCPVTATELSYAQVSFYGFDGEFHTGEMVVHRDAVDDLVAIFTQLHEMRFPIEQMEVVSQHDLSLGPDGKANNTTAFTCRRTVSGSRWSRHAFGDAIDINPVHNPYVSNSQVIPTLGASYVDRDRDVPGMISEDVRKLFADIGWTWGGDWNSVKDWMHFSATGD